ncbi:phosphatidylglycerophosphatase A [Telmatospirillum sp. J64-1]|uniref:phosphatidylglycerophosphatase A family protein n=1 Tax=Telmatospirillum sp. J64-1 TaxID=2502183 RepID=UPI00115ECE0C|nr:phosphatidylglycerophosphatase A [Telmatospirillum sp. J64-1]
MFPDRQPVHLPVWHPAFLIATWFGSGRLPGAPGTWGSLAALPVAWLIVWWGGHAALAVGVVVTFLAGWWASEIYVQRSGLEDPGAIVIDEVSGQWLVLLLAGLDPLHYLIGFVLFRIADIIKPWPASLADRRIKGGLGVMVDDMLAAVYAAIALYFIVGWIDPWRMT